MMYKGHFVVRWSDGSTSGQPDETVARMTKDYVTTKTLNKYVKSNKKQIDAIKKEIDERIG